MSRAKIKHLGHAQHFIAANSCLFRRATVVTGRHRFIISTVGEYLPGLKPAKDFEEIGIGRKYETYVFRALKRDTKGCDYPVIADLGEIDSLAANDPKTAEANHEKMIAKYARKAVRP